MGQLGASSLLSAETRAAWHSPVPLLLGKTLALTCCLAVWLERGLPGAMGRGELRAKSGYLGSISCCLTVRCMFDIGGGAAASLG